MPRFFAGDELGAIKSVSYTSGENTKEWKATTSVLLPGSSSSRSKTVQKLALNRTDSHIMIAAAHGDGSATVHKFEDDSPISLVHEWSESRLKEGQRFVGLAAAQNSIYSCTSNGALRLTKLGQDGAEPSFSLATLPMRLCEWRLSADERAFMYGGEEVEASVWDTEKAFFKCTELATAASAESKKRKRGDQLLPGEVWRAKNVPNDHLNLRQPVHNTAVTFLQPSASSTHHHLLVGTAAGNVRRYDTRAARRPVSDWKGIGKSGGISTVEKGSLEHEVFVADRGCTLSALDLRNGRTIYTYKGISGAVTSVAPAQSFMVSASQDRFVRLHSTFGPPAEAGQQQEHKGEVLDKLYMKVIPTAVVWDGDTADSAVTQADEEVDDVWDTMQGVESDSETEGTTRRKEKKTRSS